MLFKLPLSTALRITSAPSIKPLTLLLVTPLLEVVCKASNRMALSWSLKQWATSSESPGSSRFMTNSLACGLSWRLALSCGSEVEWLARFLAAKETVEALGGTIQDCVLLRLKRGDLRSLSSLRTVNTKDLCRWNFSLPFPVVCCSFRGLSSGEGISLLLPWEKKSNPFNFSFLSPKGDL